MGVSMHVFLEEAYRVAVERNRRLERLLGGVECRGRGGFRRTLEGVLGSMVLVLLASLKGVDRVGLSIIGILETLSRR